MSANETQLEFWLTIPNWDGLYQASSLGRIRSLPRKKIRPHPKNPKKNQERSYGGKVLSPKLNKNGYLAVSLYRNNKGKTIEIHRLVCMAFTKSEPQKMDVNHINGIRLDNRPNNLEWMTRKQNLMHAEKVLGTKMVWTHQKERAQQRRSL
jgi:hypothetical protein